MLCATPMIALLQGTVMLNDYRVHHKDAPSPIMPARGVVVVNDSKKTKDDNDATSNSWFSATSHNKQPLHTSSASMGQDLPPLRILVVGDSLAAGVGLSKSGTPVLPESIARALSQAHGGRVVYWTCVGTPGTSASQIIQDINDMTPRKHPSTSSLERTLKEWQYKRRIFIRRRQERERQEMEALMKEQQKAQDNEQAIRNRRNAFKQWWNRINSSSQITADKIRSTTEDVMKDWWSNVTRRVREDLTDIRELSAADPTTLSTDDDEPDSDPSSNDGSDKNGGEREELILFPASTNLFGMSRRRSLNPQAAAQFDIAIVLTGLNDVKDCFMPHMMAGDNSSVKEGTERLTGGLSRQLMGVILALRSRMNDGMGDIEEQERIGREEKAKQQDSKSVELDYSGTVEASGLPKVSYQPVETKMDSKGGKIVQDDQAEPSSQPVGRRPPLIVLPALPVAPLELFQTAPLCWFLGPIFGLMEHNKRDLAERLPNVVLFVDQPTINDWAEIKDGRGPLWDSLSRERILYELTDVAQQTRERIQQLMEQHYGNAEKQDDDNPTNWTMDQEEQQRKEKDNAGAKALPENESRAPPPPPPVRVRNRYHPGSTLVAADKIHPNDDGYEIWGQHIAAAIVKRWEL